jgi:transposase
MFGLFFGTLCLVALIFTLKRGYWGGHPYLASYGGRGSFRGGGHFGHPPWSRARRARRRWAMRWLFEELETTPGQEKAILSSLDSFRDQLEAGRGELDAARNELAQAFGGDVLDETALNAAIGRLEGMASKMRSQLVASVTEIHASLDGRQRRQAAELIADLRPFRRY